MVPSQKFNNVNAVKRKTTENWIQVFHIEIKTVNVEHFWKNEKENTHQLLQWM